MLAAVGLTLLTMSCSSGQGGAGSDLSAGTARSNLANPGDSPALEVVTTLYPLEYFTRRIGGDSVRVVNLISPGVEAHDFEPTPGDVRRLAEADLIVYNGKDFERWLDRALQAIGQNGRVVVEAGPRLANMSVVALNAEASSDAQVAAGVNDQDKASDQHSNGLIDPHVWLDPLKAAVQVEAIGAALRKAAPAQADRFAENGLLLITDLEDLHRRFQMGLSECAMRHFVTSHAAFSYLAQRYDLRQVSISGLTPEAEPSPKDLAQIADTIRDLGVQHLMAENVGNSRLVETLAAEVNAGILTLHPLESLTTKELERGETYFSVMESNLRNLRTALDCDR